MPLTGFFRSGAFFLHCILHKIRQILCCRAILFSFCFPHCTFLFCILLQTFFRHIDKKKRKAHLVLCKMPFPLKLKNRQTSRKAATQSYRACNMAASCTLFSPGKVIRNLAPPCEDASASLQESERTAGLQGFRALYQPFGRCGALLFWLK